MPIYLDYNATAPLRPEVIEKINEIMAHPANPSSPHSFGRAAKKHLEDARVVIADSINVFVDEVIFTSSGTESNTTALLGFPDRRVLVSAIEHSSGLKANPNAEYIPVTSDGVVDLAALDAMLSASNKPALVSVMFANNETGVLQPIAEVSALCKKYHALFHCDAVQGYGKLPVDFSSMGVDMLSLGAHKCGGPVGAAALVVRRDLPFKQLLKGGAQELNRRASTVNVPAVAGFAVAVEKYDLAQMQKLRGWLDAMEAETGAVVFGKNVARMPNASMLAMPGVTNQTQLIDFDLQGFAVSAGSACASGKLQGSSVLHAMGVPESLAVCAIRVSLGWNSREQDVKGFTAAWLQTYNRLNKKAISA